MNEHILYLRLNTILQIRLHFECSDPGCVKSFQRFSKFESHLDVGDHCVKDERPLEKLYDKLHRD